MHDSDNPTPSASRREFVKKALYVPPSVLTLAIAPNIPEASAESVSKSKGKGKSSGAAVAVAAPSSLGLLGLGIAAAVGSRVTWAKARNPRDSD